MYSVSHLQLNDNAEKEIQSFPIYLITICFYFLSRKLQFTYIKTRKRPEATQFNHNTQGYSSSVRPGIWTCRLLLLQPDPYLNWIRWTVSGKLTWVVFHNIASSKSQSIKLKAIAPNHSNEPTEGHLKYIYNNNTILHFYPNLDDIIIIHHCCNIFYQLGRL